MELGKGIKENTTVTSVTYNTPFPPDVPVNTGTSCGSSPRQVTQRKIMISLDITTYPDGREFIKSYAWFPDKAHVLVKKQKPKKKDMGEVKVQSEEVY